jgi:glycerate 2-kinase
MTANLYLDRPAWWQAAKPPSPWQATGWVADLAGLEEVALVTLATDGGDGPTDAAGAIVTGRSLAWAQQMGLDPRFYLARNDAYHFFAPLGDLIRTGPTQTNVTDLALIFAF